MSGIILDQHLISNLNQLKDLHLSLTKLIIDQVAATLAGGNHVVSNRQLRVVLKNEGLSATRWEQGINSFKYLLKVCLKQQLPAKKAGSFILENTLLGQDTAQYFCEKLEEIRQAPKQPPRLAQLHDIQWGAYNLRQDCSGRLVNKMYMKTVIKTIEEGSERKKVVVSTLPEFKLLLSQANQIGSALR